MLVPPSQTESDMFRACTTITIGNNNHTRFWPDKWLHRESPRELAPTLFRLAWRKNLTNGFQKVIQKDFLIIKKDLNFALNSNLSLEIQILALEFKNIPGLKSLVEF
jgi:hypothetical protein